MGCSILEVELRLNYSNTSGGQSGTLSLNFNKKPLWNIKHFRLPFLTCQERAVLPTSNLVIFEGLLKPSAVVMAKWIPQKFQNWNKRRKLELVPINQFIDTHASGRIHVPLLIQISDHLCTGGRRSSVIHSNMYVLLNRISSPRDLSLLFQPLLYFWTLVIPSLFLPFFSLIPPVPIDKCDVCLRHRGPFKKDLYLYKLYRIREEDYPFIRQLYVPVRLLIRD